MDAICKQLGSWRWTQPHGGPTRLSGFVFLFAFFSLSTPDRWVYLASLCLRI